MTKTPELPDDATLSKFGHILDDDNGMSRLEALRAAWAFAAQQANERIAEMEQNENECSALRDKLSGLLSRTAVALKGPEPPLTHWSWHDLPELANEAADALRVAHIGMVAANARAEVAERERDALQTDCAGLSRQNEALHRFCRQKEESIAAAERERDALRYQVEHAGCAAAHLGESTYECDAQAPCGLCRLRGERDALAGALRELVELRDLKLLIITAKKHPIGTAFEDMSAEYNRRKPLAWKAARAALSSHQGQEK